MPSRTEERIQLKQREHILRCLEDVRAFIRRTQPATERLEIIDTLREEVASEISLLKAKRSSS